MNSDFQRVREIVGGVLFGASCMFIALLIIGALTGAPAG